MPKFSIIAVDYEHHVNRTGMRVGLQSLVDQTFKDFELIVIHDGKKNIPYHEEFGFNQFQNPVVFLNTEQHMGDWGHSSRDLGMRHATGDYFIHFNIDNVFFPNAFQRISEEIDRTEAQVLIFCIKHYKAAGGAIFTGLPPAHCHIDAMQLVAKKEVWENVGYWYTREGTSDGIIYEEICKRFPWVHLNECLGDNY